MKKIRVGIDLNHVLRNINLQIAKCYQKDFNEELDLDELDFKDDILHDVCEFETEEDMSNFLYYDYPLEIFGHAIECDRFLMRDLNKWMIELSNNEEYEVDFFFFSMKEFDLSIGASYYFLSKIGNRVRKTFFPRNVDELNGCADVLITANKDVTKLHNEGTKIIYIKNNFNHQGLSNADVVYDSFRDFLEDKNKLNVITELECKNQKKSGCLTWKQSLISFFQKMVGRK